MIDIERDVYPGLLASGYQEELFRDLEGRKAAGREVTATCPFCGRPGKFSYSTERPVYQCWTCEAAGDWLLYLQKRRGIDFREALAVLAEAAGIKDGLEADSRGHAAYIRKASILETAIAFFQEQLFRPEGEAVLAYLKNRGYAGEDITGMEAGAYTSRPLLQAHLKRKDFSDTEIQESGLLSAGLGETHPLVFAWKDFSGRAAGLAGRCILAAEEQEKRGLNKYMYSRGLQKASGLLGLDRARGKKAVLLVEGLLDSLFLSARGLAAVAIGGTAISTEQVQALIRNRTEEVLLSLDMDGPGQKATEKAARLLREAGLRVFVVSLPGGHKDADSLVRAAGLQPLEAAMKDAQRAEAWIAIQILNRHELETDRGLEAALAECAALLENTRDAIACHSIKEALQGAVGLPEAVLNDRLAIETEKAVNNRIGAHTGKALQKASRLLSEGASLAEVEQTLQDGLQALRTARAADYLPEPYLLDNLQRDLLRMGEGLDPGFSSLERYCRIPEGALTIIAGRPGHGKTTLQLNMLLNMVKAYPERAFYFFSYEEAAAVLACKAIMILAGKVRNSPDFNLSSYMHYLREGRKTDTDAEIEAAIEQYQEYTSSGRLYFLDRRLQVEDLTDTIARLAGADRRPGAFFIDYIQKISVGAAGHRPGQRYLEIKAVSERLLDTAVSKGLAIITGAQFGRDSSTGKTETDKGRRPVRLDNLRESGDIEQDANLVLGLYNRTKAEKEEGGQDGGQESRLEVHVLKNRGGRDGGIVNLSFNGPTLKIDVHNYFNGGI